jgi:hypothetical protein
MLDVLGLGPAQRATGGGVVANDDLGFNQDGGVSDGLGLLGSTELVRERSGNVSI